MNECDFYTPSEKCDYYGELCKYTSDCHYKQLLKAKEELTNLKEQYEHYKEIASHELKKERARCKIYLDSLEEIEDGYGQNTCAGQMAHQAIKEGNINA